MQKLKENLWLQLFVIYTRFLIGGTFVFASVIKIKGLRFTTESGENTAMNTPHHFFETMYQTGLYWQFIGVGQCVAGFLLMTQVFSRLGAVVFYPIILNIFVITISMDFSGTSYVTALMLLANTALLLWEWNHLRVLVNLPQQQASNPGIENDSIWAWTGLAMFLFTFIYRLIHNRYDIFMWFGVCVAIGLGGLLIWLWKSRTASSTSAIKSF